MDFLTNFMERLTKQSGAPSNRVFNRQTRKIDRISVNNPETLGRYQVLPINSAVTEFPYVKGQVRQISLPRRRMDESGQEQPYSAWIHLPSFEFYQMKDATGRVVSSLTAEDEKLLTSAHNLWEELYKEIDGKTNYPIVKDFIRSRNITVFSAYCMNFWKYGSNSRTPDRQNFSALFMITTKNFIQSVEAGINDKIAMEGNNQDWIEKVYNNQLKNRDGFLMFSINKDRAAKGFNATAQHEVGRSQMLSGVEIPQEDFDAGMDDPVLLFLGWQANPEERDKPSGTRRLFNASLIKEACSYMGKLLSVIRAKKMEDPSAPIDILATVGEVVEDYYKGLPPMEPRKAPQPTEETAESTNYNPTPTESPTTHIDPLMGSQAPSSNGGFGGGFGGFSAPSFGGNGFDNQTSGTPF
jgi:hypothetical protein